MDQSDAHTIDQSLMRLCQAGGAVSLRPPPRISVFHRTAPSPLESHLYDPVLCVVLQGAKTLRSGEIEIAVSAGDALIVSHHLPVLSQITRADPAKPYLAIVLTIDTALIRELLSQVGHVQAPPAGAGAIASHACDPSWLDPLQRYLMMADDAQTLDVLGPSLLREIHYRLLMSPSGAILRNIIFRDSHASRIARAISLIREDVAAPLRVHHLAGEVGMSASAFHSRFKSVTGTTPLQYQKDLRLIASRGLLESGIHTVASTAFAVGYESPTHFSRDYKRKFGQSPSAQKSAKTGRDPTIPRAGTNHAR